MKQLNLKLQELEQVINEYNSQPKVNLKDEMAGLGDFDF